MIINELTKKVLEIAKKNQDGFTLSINNLEPIKTGYVVSYKATQNSFSETDLQSVINHALSHNGIVGGWYNSKDGKYYFDSNKVFTIHELAKAVEFGINNEQLAIFDLDNKKEIRLDNQPLTKEYNFSTFAEWFLSTANQVVKHYKSDLLIDSHKIVDLRNKHFFNSQSTGNQGFSLYWGIRETGTWLYPVEGGKSLFGLKDFIDILGAKKIFFITFWYDSSKNEIITIKDMDKDSI